MIRAYFYEPNKPRKLVYLDQDNFYEDDYKFFIENEILISLEILNAPILDMAIYGCPYGKDEEEYEKIVLLQTSKYDIQRKDKFRELRKALENEL